MEAGNSKESARMGDDNTSDSSTENIKKPGIHLLDELEGLVVLPQILSEGIVFAGLGSAILLQAAAPEARRNSSIESDRSSGLAETSQTFLRYILCLVFGSRHERKMIMERNKQQTHEVSASTTPLDENADARRLWMAATLYATSTDIYQRVWGQVDYRTAQRAYEEFTVVMSCLGLSTSGGNLLWPEDRQAFWTYWDDQIERLIVTADANQIAQNLLRDPTNGMPGWMRRVKPFVRSATIEGLPPRVRSQYGLKSTAGSRSMYRMSLGAVTALYPPMPKSMRMRPVNDYLRDLRTEMGVNAV